MASQFYGLNIAYTGLLASNAALNTTSNNISNIETKGYSKQVVNQTAAQALRTYTTFGCSGSGVDEAAEFIATVATAGSYCTGQILGFDGGY